ncbi:hypothetical protein KVR801_170068 [Klebsiella variicola]|nr:hypothetical protein KVR801_170068 [Klebsiella variicola]
MSGSNAKLLAAGKRLLTIFAVLWGAATLTFVAVKLIPGDPVAILIGSANSVVDDSFRETLTPSSAWISHCGGNICATVARR